MTEPPVARDLLPGSTLSGRYRLEEEIGRGGAGRVFRAHDDRLDRAVAVKVLEDLGETALTRFRREAAAAARIRHPNVVTLFDAGVHADRLPYLVMSLVAGRSLADHVQDTGPLSTDALRRLAIDLFMGVGATHDAGVLHRDLTPRNVLIDDDGAALLADFGIARRPEDPDVTAEHTVMGTRPFVAPERLRGREATIASDLYSAGITLRYAATGDHATPMPRDHPLALLVAACTAADPAHRPASARAAADLVDERPRRRTAALADTEAMAVTDDATMVATPPPPATSSAGDGEGAAAPASSRRPVAVVGVLVALVVVALVGTLTVDDAGDPAARASDTSAPVTPAAPTFDADAPAESSRRLAEWLRGQGEP